MGAIGKMFAVEKKRKDFQKMGFAGTEKTRDPDPVGFGLIEVTFEEQIESFADFAGDDEFFKLGLKVTIIIGLDDAFDGAFHWFGEETVNFHVLGRR